MGCCLCCSRVFVFILNLFMLLASLAVLALAIWIRADDSFEAELRRNIKREDDPEPLSGTKDDMRTGIIVSFWVIVAFSAGLAITGFAGLLGAAASSRALLAAYFGTLILFILGEIGLGIFVLVYRPTVRETVYEYVQDSYLLSPQDVAAIQYRYNCCGVLGEPNRNCMGGLPTCSSAVWDRLDFTLMIFGICELGVVILQLVTACVSVVVFGYRKREISY